MNLKRRIEVLSAIGAYILSGHPDLEIAKMDASARNNWFIPANIDISLQNIAKSMLDQSILQDFIATYNIPDIRESPKTIGLVMAGNIPLVGFHDMVCVFLSGHKQRIKLSSKDETLMKYLLKWAESAFPEITDFIQIDDMLKGCDAYIATGSDNTARYFEQYFQKYPNIIRKNRTSIALLTGEETQEELSLLADDIQLYFGFGCRNVTQVLVPVDYDFVPLLTALRKFDYYKEHAKYRNNFDYQLTIAIMNNQFYMTNESIVLIEHESPFSPIGQLNYRFYKNREEVMASLDMNKIQCIIGKEYISFGMAQKPKMTDFADGIDTLSFLSKL